MDEQKKDVNFIQTVGDNDSLTVSITSTPNGSSMTYVDATKVGARHSSRDQAALQAAHDALVNVGAMCDTEGKALDPDEIMVIFGDTVKALEGGKVAGYLVRYSTETDPDLTGDHFTSETDFGDATKSAVLYQHGMDETLKRRKIGDGELRKDDVGVWIEAQLNLRDEYEKAIYELAKKGKLGWSSGTAGHLVERNKSGKILSWHLGLDASLTPTPAEPRNGAITLKSLLASEMADAKKGERNGATTPKENLEMERDDIKALFDEQKSAIVDLVKTEAESAAAKAVENVLDKLPEVKARMNGDIQVTQDEADVPFKSIGENLQAITNQVRKGKVAPRMKALHELNVKASLGSNELIPSQGEFLLEPTLVADFMKPVHETGPFSAATKKMPVGPNSNSGWINGIDETSRVHGSRWGGVRAYWLAEADAMTASQPKFRRINWELHKLAVLQYASDEILADANLLNSIIMQSASEELSFLVNDAIVRGSGAGQPLGILNSAALISATRTDANEIDHADVQRMINRLPAARYASAVWYCHPDTQPQIDSLNISTSLLSPYVNYTPNGVTMLRGRPVVYSEFNPTLGSVGDILLVDMSDYLMWEKGGVQAAASIHVQFLTDQTAFRFIYRVDGQPATQSALTPYQGSTTTSPYIALAAST